MLLHQAAHCLPFCWADASFEAPIRDDFDHPVGHLHVDQDSIVMRRIPYLEGGEDIDGTRARRHAVQDVQRRQGRFDRKTDLLPPWVRSQRAMACSMASSAALGNIILVRQ